MEPTGQEEERKAEEFLGAQLGRDRGWPMIGELLLAAYALVGCKGISK